MEKKVIGYQIASDENTNPYGLFSWQIFRTLDLLNRWAKDNGIKLGGNSGWHIIKVAEGDIEEPEYLCEEHHFEKEDKNYIRGIVNMILSSIFTDEYDNELVTTTIIDEVIEDIEETADEHFNDSDVRIAVARVLKNRLGVIE